MKKILELIGRTIPLVFLVAHCSTQADSGSQTHWLGTCVEDVECGAGLLCRCGRCMKECTDGACSGLPRPAECAQPGSPALAAQCENVDRPTCLAKCTGTEGCSSDEKCVSGLCVNLWLGAPCEECDLPTQVARLAEPGSEDCGTISSDGGNAASAGDCALAAFRAGRPFTIINPPATGIDSTVSSALVFTGSHLYVLEYDSNVCGGGSSCEALTCGPSIGRYVCIEPMTNPEAHAILGCTSMGDLQALCGPNPRCYGGVCM